MPVEYASDDDFRAPPEPTCAELEAGVRDRMSRDDGWDAELVEDMRLLILVKYFRGEVAGEIIDGLASAGPPDRLVAQRDYLEKLVAATFRNGSHGEMEVQTEWHVGGGAMAVFRNPVYDQAAKAAGRAEKLHDKARRMAHAADVGYDPALAFSTRGNATDHLAANARSERRYVYLAATIMAVAAAAIVAYKQLAR